MQSPMSLPRQRDAFQTFARIVIWATVALHAILLCLLIGVLFGPMLGVIPAELSCQLVPYAGYATMACIVCVIGTIVTQVIAESYFTVSDAQLADGWTFWVHQDCHLVAAEKRRYWFSTKDSLIALRAEMACEDRWQLDADRQFVKDSIKCYCVENAGDLKNLPAEYVESGHRAYSSRYSVKLVDRQVTADVGYAFCAWWNDTGWKDPKHTNSLDWRLSYRKDSVIRGNLPFKVSALPSSNHATELAPQS